MHAAAMSKSFNLEPIALLNKTSYKSKTRSQESGQMNEALISQFSFLIQRTSAFTRSQIRSSPSRTQLPSKHLSSLEQHSQNLILVVVSSLQHGLLP